jgi:uncharacterized SAM-binding protein YcdF (DUF218 family)
MLRVAGLLVVAVVLVLAHTPLLRAVGSFLVVNDPPEAAQAIIVLAGGLPFRELEAADTYRAGLAPKIILVPEYQNQEPALQARGLPTTSDRRRKLLIRLGVPPDAIVVLQDEAFATVDELQIAARAVNPTNGPVILVTSKYHSRRVSLVWAYVTGGQPQGLVRSAHDDPFAPDTWWQDPSSARIVVWEYAGLLNLGVRWTQSRLFGNWHRTS